jgi:hypothetical protein
MNKDSKIKQVKKKYHFSVVEEAILNPDPKYKGLRGGRIEIWHKDEPYDVAEIGIVLPYKIFDEVYEAIDFKEADYFVIGNVSSEELDKEIAQRKIGKNLPREEKN